MGRINRLFKVLLPVFLLLASATLASEPLETLHFIGRYDFNYSGIYLGNLILSIDETDTAYTMRLLVKSGGIVNLFTRHTSDTIATGKRIGATYQPLSYESHYKTKEKPRHIKLGFNSRGAITEELVEPPEDRNDRPEVPHNLKDSAFDPLTGLMVMRSGIDKLHVFDAKRLYELKAEPDSKRALQLKGGTRNGVSYNLSRTPLSGLTGKEMKEYNKGEPQLVFYFSNNTKRIPLAVFMPIYLGHIEGTLTKECKIWDECTGN